MDITSYMEIFGLMVLALVFGFSLRLPFAKPEGSNSDQWGVLGKIKKHIGLRWINYSMPDAIPKGIFPYPMLLHFLISRFPEKYWKVLNVFINQGADLVVSIVVFVVVLLLAPVDGGVSGVDLAWLGALLFLSLPVLMPITARMIAHNGRCFGMLLNTIYLLSLYAVIASGSVFGWIACIVLLLAIFLTSFFAMQTAVYFSVGLAVWYWHWVPLCVIGIALAISFLFPALGARDTLVFKVNHFKWYWSNYNKNTTATGRDLFKNFFLFFKHFPKDRVESITIFYRTSSLWAALYSVPCFWFLAVLLGISPEARLPLTNGLGAFCLALVVLTFVAFLLSSIGKFVIFGTSERYFEYGSPFLAITFSLAIAASGLVAWKVFLCFIVLQVGIIFFNDTTYSKRFFRWLREPETGMADSVLEVMDYFTSQPNGARVATVPIKLPILFRAHNPSPETVKFYYRFIQQSLKLDAFKYFDDDIEELNVFKGAPDDLVRNYGITYVLIQRSYLKPGRFEFIDSVLGHEVLFENDQYVVFSAVEKKKRADEVEAEGDDVTA